MSINISSTVLDELSRDKTSFQELVAKYMSTIIFQHTGRRPMLSPRRLEEAHKYWCTDVERVKHSLPAGCHPDHFKQAAHLAYWLRRTSPIVDFYGEACTEPNADQHKNWDFIATFANEYVAFEIGYQICNFFEIGRKDPHILVGKFTLEPDYTRDMCCFLKEKNVSPHALYLVFKSLFYKRYN